MRKLKEKDLLPLLLGTSLMLQRVPCYNTTCKDDKDATSVVTRVKALEESMNEYMKQQTTQMTSLMETINKMNSTSVPNSQHQRVRVDSVSKKHKLDNDDNNVFQPCGRALSSFQPSAPPQPTFQPSAPPQPTFQPSAPPQPGYYPSDPHQPTFQPSAPPQPTYQPSAPPQHGYYQSAPAQPAFQPSGSTAYQPQHSQKSYANAMAGTAQNNQPSGQTKPPFRPRKQSTLLFGKSKTGRDNQTQLLAANVNLVASGVSKAATDKQLKDFLEEKGIKVTEIENMTYHPEARTNTFRVAIAIEDYEKALNPEVWPYRVAVRNFRPARRDREQKSMESQFGRTGGVVHSQPQQAHQHQAHSQPQQPQQRQGKESQQTPQTPEVIEVSNRFDTLAEMEDADN